MKTKKPKYTHFRPVVFSRHPSHDVLRRKNKKLPLLPFRAVVRFGSVTEHTKDRVECNTIEGVKNSMSKLRMKRCFIDNEVESPDYYTYDRNTGKLYQAIKGEEDKAVSLEDLEYPIIAKRIFGSRGRGMEKLDNQEALDEFIDKEFDQGNRTRYYFESYKNYTKEYRLHVTEDGCFYTNRKMLKSDTPEEDRYFRNDSNSVWYLESNEKFDKPGNWQEIVDECVKSLKAVKLDIGACDVRVSKTKDGKAKFAIIEINSAPSFGDITEEKYIEQIPLVLKRKANM